MIRYLDYGFPWPPLDSNGRIDESSPDYDEWLDARILYLKRKEEREERDRQWWSNVFDYVATVALVAAAILVGLLYH